MVEIRRDAISSKWHKVECNAEIMSLSAKLISLCISIYYPGWIGIEILLFCYFHRSPFIHHFILWYICIFISVGVEDNLKNPSANIIVGKLHGAGTGSFDLFTTGLNDAVDF